MGEGDFKVTLNNKKNITFDTSLWEKILEKQHLERETKRQEIIHLTILKLKDYFKDKEVKKVYIVGSLLREGEFYEFSDIDIAVEGLKEDYFRTCAEIEDIVDRNIDLIEIEKCKFFDSIERHGVRVV